MWTILADLTMWTTIAEQQHGTDQCKLLMSELNLCWFCIYRYFEATNFCFSTAQMHRNDPEIETIKLQLNEHGIIIVRCPKIDLQPQIATSHYRNLVCPPRHTPLYLQVLLLLLLVLLLLAQHPIRHPATMAHCLQVGKCAQHQKVVRILSTTIPVQPHGLIQGDSNISALLETTEIKSKSNLCHN